MVANISDEPLLSYLERRLRYHQCNKEEFPYWDFSLNVKGMNKRENNVLYLKYLLKMKIIFRKNKNQTEYFLKCGDLL